MLASETRSVVIWGGFVLGFVLVVESSGLTYVYIIGSTWPAKCPLGSEFRNTVSFSLFPGVVR